MSSRVIAIKFAFLCAATVATLTITALTVTTLPAHAQITARISSGSTSILITSEFSQTLGGVGIGTLLASPTRQRRGLIRIPISGGQLDTTTLKGEIMHEGGIRFSDGRSAVDLLNFIIVLADSTPTVTGLVRINNAVVGRIPLFTVMITEPIASRYSRHLNFLNSAVYLRAEAVDTLNEVFSTRSFNTFTSIGLASSTARLNYSFRTRSLKH